MPYTSFHAGNDGANERDKAMKSGKLFYSLLVRENGEWSIQRQSYDLREVESERDFYVVARRCIRRDTFIITTFADDDSVNDGLYAVQSALTA